MSRIIKFSNIDNIIKSYLNGVSVNQLSKENGVSRSVIDRVLKSNNIQLRNQSQAEKIKWDNMSETQRKRQYQKAHKATIGRVIPTSEKIKRAKSAQINAFKSGLLEEEIINSLKNIGYSPTHQRAFGIYNIDISVNGFPIAIEVQCSGHNLLRTKKYIKRAEYICRSEFLLYIIIDQSKNPLDLFGITYKVVSYLQRLSWDKSIIGKYAMIGRDGKPLPVSCYNFNNLTRIE